MAKPIEERRKRNPSAKKNGGPRDHQVGDATGEAIVALKTALIKESKTNREEESRRDTGSKWIEIATLVFVIATTGGIFYQAHILNKSDHAFQKTAAAAKDSADIAQNTLIVSQRAYVFARPGNVYNVDDEKTPEPRIVFGNSGTTIGRQTKRWAKAVVSKPKTPEETSALGRGDLEPGVVDVAPRVEHPIIRYAEKMARGERKDISSHTGPLRLYVYGRIEYLDIFQTPHFTDFCFVYYGEMQDWPKNGGWGFNSSQARYCEGHNDSD